MAFPVLIILALTLWMGWDGIGVAQPGPPGPGAPPPTMLAGKIIVGQVLRIEKDLYVIRTEDGQAVEVQIDSTTFLDGALRVGDKVEVVVLADGHARSVVHAR